VKNEEDQEEHVSREVQESYNFLEVIHLVCTLRFLDRSKDMSDHTHFQI
jgi:hypothetical protein